MNIQNFSDIDSALTYLEETHNFEFEKPFYNKKGYITEVKILQNYDTTLLSFIKNSETYSNESFFESDEFKLFSNKNERDSFLKHMPKNMLFFLVDKYEHSSVHYSVHKSITYPDSRWDVAFGCGIYIPPNDIQKEFKKLLKTSSKEDAIKHFEKNANQVLESYSDYCNGEIYDIVNITYDNKGNIKNDDLCCEYIGFDNTKKIQDEQIYEIIKNAKIEDLYKSVYQMQIDNVNFLNQLNTLNKRSVNSILKKLDINESTNLTITMSKAYSNTVFKIIFNDIEKSSVLKISDNKPTLNIFVPSIESNKYNISKHSFADNNFKYSLFKIIEDNLPKINTKQLSI